MSTRGKDEIKHQAALPKLAGRLAVTSWHSHDGKVERAGGPLRQDGNAIQLATCQHIIVVAERKWNLGAHVTLILAEISVCNVRAGPTSMGGCIVTRFEEPLFHNYI